MKKLSNKIKSLYTLTAILVLSLCMILFPVSAKPASADAITDAANTITIQSAYIQTSNIVDENSEFVFMFKAKINEEAYNTITNNGQNNVRFGMLIGPTERMINVSDYETAKAQDFEEFAHVGTRSSGVYQHPDFRQSEDYSYSAGIIYNKEALEEMSEEKGQPVSMKDVVAIELTAIPFYIIEDTPYLVLDNQKSCLPRDVLAESYVKELNANITNIPEAVVETYVGETEVMSGEHYICRDTARLMSSSTVGGDLEPNAASVAEDVVYIDGVRHTNINTLSLPTELLESLPMYGKANIIIYSKANGTISKYSTSVAERVITRFADKEIGQTENIDETKDYLAKAGESSYDSIFMVNNGSVKFREGSAKATENGYITTRSVVLRTLDIGYEGLYVLGKNISLPTNHNYITDAGSAFSSGTGYKAQVTTGGGKDSDMVRVAYAPPIAYVGFNGTFDGRGHSIDLKERATKGVLPPAFDATIKNTAFYGLQTNINGGGITSHARLTTFENIYAQVTKATNYSGDLNKGILMNIQDCDIKNFVADVNAITADVMTGTLPTYQATTASKPNGSGVGQGVTTSGVFSFRAYPDAYYDANIAKVRIANSTEQLTNAGMFLDNISLVEVQRLFPNMINKDGAAVWALYNPGAGTNYKVAPLADDYLTMRDSSQATAFTGSTGVNVYAVGSSPLYVGYDYSLEQGGSTAASPPGTALAATEAATVFVNQAPTLKAGGTAEVNWKQEGTSYVAPTAYAMSDIDGNLFAFADDTTYTLGEIIYRGKLYRHGSVRMANLLDGSQAKDVLKVRFINQEGFYDVANMDEMKSYVLAQETPFDNLYWNVGTDGSVAWKNPIA